MIGYLDRIDARQNDVYRQTYNDDSDLAGQRLEVVECRPYRSQSHTDSAIDYGRYHQLHEVYPSQRPPVAWVKCLVTAEFFIHLAYNRKTEIRQM